jgi:hypothetical protein
MPERKQAMAGVEAIEITAPSMTGSWRKSDRIFPVNWDFHVLGNKRGWLGLGKVLTRNSREILNMSVDGVAFRVKGKEESAPGNRFLVQLDKCKPGFGLVHYEAVVEVVRCHAASVSFARFVNPSESLIRAIEHEVQVFRSA